MKKVLMLSAYIPHYREELIKKLSEKCNLTVTSLDVEKLNLIPLKDNNKNSYRLLKTKPIHFFDNAMNLKIIPKEIILSCKYKWEIIYAFFSFRYPHRMFVFLYKKIFDKNTKWIWVGHIYGENNNILIKFLRRILLNSSDGVLTYTNFQVKKLKSEGVRTNVFSFNNTYVKREDVQFLPTIHGTQEGLNIIFVGRYQKRKKIERLINLVKRRTDINLRLIGPGMNQLKDKIHMIGLSDRVKIFGAKIGDELKPHFMWSHIVANPGHVGLLVVTAGQYGRPIIIDNQCKHAPEYIIAQEAGQDFINWADNQEVDEIIDLYKNYPENIVIKGKRLFDLIKKEYTIENSIKAFTRFL